MGSHRVGSSGAEAGTGSSRGGARAHRLPRFERQPARSRGQRSAQFAVRGGVLASLLAATVVVPVSQGALSFGSPIGGVLGQIELPSTVGALSAQSVGGQVPAALSPAGTVVERDLEAASRGLDRGGRLPNCEGVAPAKLSSNGNMPDRDLCTLWDGKTKVRGDYAVALAELNQAYVARFGVDMCITSGYRSLADQYATKRRAGYMAATPGTSNHGLGLAVDFCDTTYKPAGRYQWLRDNGPKYDIDNPEWAQKQKYEPWHWEFMSAVARDNSINGSTASGR
ncbi:MAG: M15 family metallopeptidase [Micrococcales bacterium]|nr:M15 family metallopeptidase [Micrococcales bacterium]